MQLKINTLLFLRNLHKGNSREQNQLVTTPYYFYEYLPYKYYTYKSYKKSQSQ